MKKSLLQNFINKYHLAGIAESVKVVSNGKLECNFVSDDQNLVGNVTLNSNQLENAELGIYQTSQLNKLLTALDEDLDIKLDKANDTVFSMVLSDKKTNVKFMLADLSIIKKTPALKDLPAFDIELELDSDVVDKFIRAKNALSDANIFAVKCDGKTTQFILNYSTTLTNRITFNVKTTKASNTDMVAFSANTFKEILVANKGMKGTMKISSKGIAKIEFSDKEFSCFYYIVKQLIS